MAVDWNTERRVVSWGSAARAPAAGPVAAAEATAAAPMERLQGRRKSSIATIQEDEPLYEEDPLEFNDYELDDDPVPEQPQDDGALGPAVIWEAQPADAAAGPGQELAEFVEEDSRWAHDAEAAHTVAAEAGADTAPTRGGAAGLVAVKGQQVPTAGAIAMLAQRVSRLEHEFASAACESFRFRALVEQQLTDLRHEARGAPPLPSELAEWPESTPMAGGGDELQALFETRVSEAEARLQRSFDEFAKGLRKGVADSVVAMREDMAVGLEKQRISLRKDMDALFCKSSESWRQDLRREVDAHHKRQHSSLRKELDVELLNGFERLREDLPPALMEALEMTREASEHGGDDEDVWATKADTIRDRRGAAPSRGGVGVVPAKVANATLAATASSEQPASPPRSPTFRSSRSTPRSDGWDGHSTEKDVCTESGDSRNSQSCGAVAAEIVHPQRRGSSPMRVNISSM